MYRLVFLTGRLKGRRIAVQQGSLLIGRDPECQIDLIDDDRVSRRHAQIEERADGVYIKDLGSRNPVELNGKPVREAKLKHGDRLEVGGTVMEYQWVEPIVASTRRRIGGVQALAFVAIGIILLAQLLFIFIFSNTTTVQIVETYESLPKDGSTQAVDLASGSATQSVESFDATLEAEMKKVVARLESIPTSTVDTVSVPATNGMGAVDSEVESLRASVEELRKQITDMNKDLGVVTAPAIDVEKIRSETEQAAARAEAATLVVATSAPPANIYPFNLLTTSAPPAGVTVEPPTGRESVTDVVAAVAEEDESPPEPVPAPQMNPSDKVPRVSSDALVDRAREMLTEALVAESKQDVVKADDLLERIQIMAPDFTPAYVERARICEARGLLKQAGEQWAQVMNLSMGTPLYDQAAAERTRIARAELAGTMTSGKSKPESSGSRLPRRIRIATVEREKFQGTKDYDEMRIVRITMKPKLSEGQIDSSDVKVLVTFYDRGAKSQDVRPSRAVVPEEPLRVEGPWLVAQQRTVSAAYIVPKGFRERDMKNFGEAHAYEGFRIQVYYRDQLQDEDAVPKSLLAHDAPSLSDSANSPVSR